MEVNAAETIAPKPEGLPEQNPGSQEQKPPEQSGASVQEGQQGAVETPKPVTTRQADAEGQEKPRPRDFYERREREKKIFSTVTSLSKEFQEFKKFIAEQKNQPAPAANGKPDAKVGFWDNADNWVNSTESKIEKALKRIEEIENGLPAQFENYEKQKEYQKADQEVTGLAAKAGLTEQDVADYLNENGLGDAYRRNPQKVWKMIAPELGIKPSVPASRPPTSPNTPTKAQMGTTAAGVPAQGTPPNVDSIRKAHREMMLQRAAKPELRFDANFNARIAELEKQLTPVSK